jgi:hypothetical protein
MIWNGIDLVELGMVIFLMVSLLHGLYGTYRSERDGTMVLPMWIVYTFFSGLFLLGILDVVTVDDAIIDFITGLV